MSFTVGSVFSGIAGIDLGFERAGARVIWNCEIDAACRKVLRHHYPGIPRFKDVKTVTGQGLGAAGLRPDCLVGGFPCQDLSVAGARAGLGGERSGLFFEFARLLEETQPQWFLIENVPGLLSSDRGGDMGVLLSTLVNLGYGVAWRVLDAQYFGVAQRRRRVFIVGCAGDAARARAVLLVGEGGGGDPPARRAEGPVPAALTANGVGTCGADDNQAQAGHFVPAVSNSIVAHASGGPHYNHNNEALIPVATHAVRRLTPLECLRLQGFPDGWLDGLGLADSVKYRCIGNAVAVPVVEWIAKRMVAAA